MISPATSELININQVKLSSLRHPTVRSSQSVYESPTPERLRHRPRGEMLPIRLTHQNFLVRWLSEDAKRKFLDDMMSIGIDPSTTPDGLADAFRHFQAGYVAGTTFGNIHFIAYLSELTNRNRMDDADVQMDINNNRVGLEAGANDSRNSPVDLMLAFIDAVFSGRIKVVEKTKTDSGQSHSELRSARPSDISLEWDGIDRKYTGSKDDFMVA